MKTLAGMFLIVGLAGCGAGGPSGGTTADQVVAACVDIRGTIADLEASNWTEQLDIIANSDTTDGLEAQGISGEQVRAECGEDVDRLLALYDEVLNP